LVRMGEMHESVRIIAQCLDRMAEGEVRAKVGRAVKPRPGRPTGGWSRRGASSAATW